MVPRMPSRGDGYFAGLAPNAQDPNSTDGRFRILNLPARGRISIYERSTMRVIESVLSAEDGTWEIGFLDRSQFYVIIGWDGRGLQNAAIQDWVKPAPME